MWTEHGSRFFDEALAAGKPFLHPPAERGAVCFRPEYREEHNIQLIPFKHYEVKSDQPTRPRSGRLARQDKNLDGKLQADEIPAKVRDEILRDIDTDKNNVLEGPEIEALLKKYFRGRQGNR